MNRIFSLQNRLYTSTFINTFGSWLTFLGIALVVKEKHGAQQVAFVFLVQTLPAILFSRSLSSLIPSRLQEKAYWIVQILLSLNCLVLLVSDHLSVIYAHLFLGALLRSVSTPLFNTILGKWVPAEQQKEAFTRVGALQAGTLALAPAAGAWIKITYSANAMFITDALTFLLSICLLRELFVAKDVASEDAPTSAVPIWKSVIAGISLRPGDMPNVLRLPLFYWFLFLAVGALLNAIEFAGFEKIGMTEQEIGYVMAAWGVGSLAAFLFPAPSAFGRSKLQAIGYALSLALFVFSVHANASVAAFFFAGLFSSYLSGALRAQLQSSVPPGYNAAPVWAYANQITQVINLICYASAGAILGLTGFTVFGCLMIVIALPLAIQLPLATDRIKA